MLGDLNVYTRVWNVSSKTDHEGRTPEIFVLSNDLTNIINDWIFFSRKRGSITSKRIFSKQVIDSFIKWKFLYTQGARTEHKFILWFYRCLSDQNKVFPPNLIWHLYHLVGSQKFFSSFLWNTVCLSSLVESNMVFKQTSRTKCDPKFWFSRYWDECVLGKIRGWLKCNKKHTPENWNFVEIEIDNHI